MSDILDTLRIEMLRYTAPDADAAWISMATLNEVIAEVKRLRDRCDRISALPYEGVTTKDHSDGLRASDQLLAKCAEKGQSAESSSRCSIL